MAAVMDGKSGACDSLDFVRDWSQWRSTLKEAIHQGREAGLSDSMMQSLSVKVGDFLATRVCPETKEEELLREMWDVADIDERKILAQLIFKMVE